MLWKLVSHRDVFCSHEHVWAHETLSWKANWKTSVQSEKEHRNRAIPCYVQLVAGKIVERLLGSPNDPLEQVRLSYETAPPSCQENGWEPTLSDPGSLSVWHDYMRMRICDVSILPFLSLLLATCHAHPRLLCPSWAQYHPSWLRRMRAWHICKKPKLPP